MIKKTKYLFCTVFLLSFNFIAYSSDQDMYELNVGDKSLSRLEDIPHTEFRVSHIKLVDLSEKKFFNGTIECKSDPANYKKSICSKLLSAIEEGYVEKVECTYKGEDSALCKLKDYMYVLACQNPILKTDVDRGLKTYWLDGIIGHVPKSACHETKVYRRIIVIEHDILNEASVEFLKKQELSRHQRMLEEAEKRDEVNRENEDRRESMGTTGYNIMNATDPFYKNN